MFMRIVHAKYKPELLTEIQKIFDNKIIPRLQKTEGCLCVCLIKSEIQRDEGVSMSLWDTQDHAEAYEKSGLYQEFLEELKPFLNNSSEWKIQLSKDLVLKYQSEEEEPVIKSYTSVLQENKKIPVWDKNHFMHVRIVSVKIQKGKIEEFKQIYNQEVIPALHKVEGFLYAYMTESHDEKDTILSVTIWNKKEDADEYEKSGMFNRITEKLKHTFSDLYQWKMKLEMESGRKVATSEDLTVKHYSIVTGKSFQ